MARILIAWELGGGLGHLARLAPIVSCLREYRHDIYAMVRDLSKVDKLYPHDAVTFLQAPFKISQADPLSKPRSFPQILQGNGFGDVAELRGLCSGWRSAYQLIRPDLILCDHAPTALLAARELPARRATIGTGFACPPDVKPLPDIRPWLPDATTQLQQSEDVVLRNANAVLDSWQLQPLDRVSQLYHDVDAEFLTTISELDHYPIRGDVKYFGTWLTPGGEAPQWPNKTGKRIFAYLKPFKSLPNLLRAIQQTGSPTLVYVDGGQQLREQFETPTVRFARERLDLAAVQETCDLAILNGGHNVTCMMLLAGKPVMTIPLNLEQAYNGSSVARLGAGFGSMPEHPETFTSTLSDVLHNEKYRRGAQQVAAKYAGLDPLNQLQEISDQLHAIASMS